MSNEWAETEFTSLNLGHKRIDKRAIGILDTLGKNPNITIPQAFNTAGEIKACYRFFDNDLVTPNKILRPHCLATYERIKECKTVLVVSDTTSLNYTNKPSIQGLGAITHKSNRGLWSHCSLAITPERLPLGIVHTKLWARKELKTHLTDHQVYGMPIQEKELFRWVESYATSCEIAKECPDTQIITVFDREGDFAELFEEVNRQQQSNKHAEIIVRGSYDRTVIEEDDKVSKKLKACLREKSSLGNIKFDLSNARERDQRTVIQTITTAKVSFRKRQLGKEESSLVTMNVVMASEERVQAGVKPLCWFFYTTLPVSTLEEAKKVIEYYLARWEIETFFNVLKTGCKIEEKQLREISRMESLIAIYLIIAWRVMYTLMLGRCHEDQECTTVFSENEWKSAWVIQNKKKPLPEKPPNLGEFVKLVAMFGGYLNRKNDKPPGVKVMWKGLQRLRDFSMGWEAFQEFSKNKKLVN